MSRSRSTLVTAAAVLLLATACSQNTDEETPSGAPSAGGLPTSITAPAEPTQGQPATQTESAATVTGSPDATQTGELITRLEAISPGLGKDEDRVVTAAAEVCQQVVRGVDEATLSSDAKARFAVDGAAPLTDEQSRAVADAVTSTFCHE